MPKALTPEARRPKPNGARSAPDKKLRVLRAFVVQVSSHSVAALPRRIIAYLLATPANRPAE